ncbi:MAG TPA: polysaccharide biosynthesis protein [Syntrophomonas sp.]|jgi:O-antigen/teichoic acid export membrane protein|nr:polysaccharide biosynthesis protein [Syntrophomonas sp.]
MKHINPVKPLSLQQNISWSLLGNAVYSVCQWGILMVLAKRGSALMVGQFALSLAITAPVYMFSNLQLRVVQATDARNQYAFGHYLGLRVLTVTASLLIIGLIIMAGDYQGNTAWVILWVGLAKGFESFSDIVFGLLQKHECMNRVAVSLLFKGPLTLLVVVLALWTTGSIVAAVMGLALVWLLLLLGYDLVNARQFSRIQPVLELRKLRPLILISLPLGVVMMFISLNTNIPRYFIEGKIGTEELGYFAALTYVTVAGAVMIDALERSAAPRLAKYYSGGLFKDFRALLLKLVLSGLALGVAGLVVVLLFGPKILTILYQPGYAAYAHVFALIMVGSGLGYMASFFGCAMTAARCFKIQPFLHALIVLVSVLSSAVLIPLKGLEGAAYVLIITMSLQLAGSFLISGYLLRRAARQPEGTSIDGQREGSCEPV